ncbi:MAG: helix-turn-helix domain-containing protein [Candidatus Freyarchaeota archaeon]
MARERVVVTRNVSFEELEKRYKEEKNPRVKLRILMVWRVKEGVTTIELGRELHVHHSTISSWVKRFNEQGFDGLRDRPKSGRPPKISHEEFQEVLEKNPRDEGYPLEAWSVKILQVHLKKRSVNYNLSYLYEKIKKHGYCLITPRPQHHKADPEAAKEFKKR